MFFSRRHPASGWAVLWLLLVALTSCSLTRHEGELASTRGMQVAPENGRVHLLSDSVDRIVQSSERVGKGDTISTSADAVARLTTGAGNTVEVWGGRLKVSSPSSFKLLTGRVLVSATSPIRIDAGGMLVSARSATFRIDKQLASRVANYSGNLVTVALRPEALEVPPFRQVVTVQGILPKVAQPLRFSGLDRWDRRLLPDAIDLDARVSNFAEGLEAQLGQTHGLDLFRAVAGGDFSVEFIEPYLLNRRSDLLIALVVSREATRFANLPLDLRFDRIFSLWNQGATWGLLSQEFGVRTDDLFVQLTRAVARAQIQVIGPGPALLRSPQLLSRRTPVRPGPRPSTARAPVSVPPAGAPQPKSPALVPAPVGAAVPDPVKRIVEDLYGVLDPVTDLPPVL